MKPRDSEGLPARGGVGEAATVKPEGTVADQHTVLEEQATAAVMVEEQAEDEATIAERPWYQRALGTSSTYTFLILVVIAVVFSLLRPSTFLSGNNMTGLLYDSAVMLVLATGMTFVLITAGIDLSVGSVLVLSGVVAVKVTETVGGDGGWVTWIGIAAAVLTGALVGTINGLLVAYAKIPALIVTLGSMGIALGAAQIITTGIDLRSNLYADFGIKKIAGIPYLVILGLVVAAIAAVLLHLSRFGRYTYAIGSNEEAARRAGINVEKHLVKVYALAGTCAGIAGFMSLSRFLGTTIVAHSTDALQAVTAVVLGGTSLFGGIGTIIGTIIGVFIPVILRNGLLIVQVQSFWQDVAVGIVLIAAVWFDTYKRRKSNRQ